MNMPTILLDRIQLMIGRMLGQSKRKDKDIVESWQALCHTNAINPTDRLLELLAWDLINNGQNLGEIKAATKIGDAKEILQEAEIASSFRQLISDLNTQLINKDIEHRKSIESLLQQNMQTMMQVANLTAEVQRQNETQARGKR